MSENLASWAGEQMAGGAAGAVGASLFNYGLSQLGISMPGDPSAALAAIQQTLNRIVGILNDIENEINDLKYGMELHFDQSDYRNAANAIEEKVDIIFELTKKYHISVTAGSPDTLPKVDQELLDTIERELLFKQTVIHNTLIPSGVPSVYELYTDMLRLEHRFLSYKDSDAIQSRINYYQSAQYLESLLLIVYHHAQNTQATTQNGGTLRNDGDTKAQIDDVIKTLQDNMVAENCFQVLHIPEGMVYDQKSFMQLWVKNCDYVVWDAAVALTAGFTVGGFGCGLPSLAELLSSDKVDGDAIEEPLQDVPAGLFTGYDSQGGKISPAKWLHNNGVPDEYYLDGLHFWTSDTPSVDRLLGTNFAHYFVDITNEDTLFRNDPPAMGYPGTLGHTLRTNRICYSGDQPYPYPMKSDGDAGFRRPPLSAASASAG